MPWYWKAIQSPQWQKANAPWFAQCVIPSADDLPLFFFFFFFLAPFFSALLKLPGEEQTQALLSCDSHLNAAEHSGPSSSCKYSRPQTYKWISIFSPLSGFFFFSPPLSRTIRRLLESSSEHGLGW